jgi:tRNA-modifying protein YgfZ
MKQLLVAKLDHLAVLRVRGPDGRKFLQGQLSNDVELLDRSPALLAGLHNPQGRTIALLRLFEVAPGDLLAVLPAELLQPVQQRLARFVLRAKVQVESAVAEWRVYGVMGPDAIAAVQLRKHTPEGGPGARFLVIAPRHEPVPEGDELDASAWRAMDIAAGQPQVYSATSEAFVAQMLNLDALGGISFTKGCYTGQEIIARAHYRGRVKRRLQRFSTQGEATLEPGQTLRLPDGRDARVVDAVRLDSATQEFLAVAALPDTGAGDGASTEAAAATGTDAGVTPATLVLADARPLPLPYVLPA